MTPSPFIHTHKKRKYYSKIIIAGKQERNLKAFHVILHHLDFKHKANKHVALTMLLQIADNLTDFFTGYED